MTRAKTDKLYRSFTKGLITEAGFLTYPDDASIDELNTVISQKGNRHRRLGLDNEGAGEGTVVATLTPDTVVSEYLWRSPDNKSDLNFLCVQVGQLIRFFDTSFNADENNSISDGFKSFDIDLLNYKISTATDEQVINTPVEMVAGKGYLFIVQKYIEPVTIVYRSEDDAIEDHPIIIMVRDFDGVNDGLANDTEPATLSNEHKYNLQNQGWVTPGTQPVDSGDPEAAPGGSEEYYDPYTGERRRWNKLEGTWEVAV